MSTNMQVESATIRASAVLTSSFVAGTMHTFTKYPRAFSLACTYTRSAGIAGYAEMIVEVSPDNVTWYYATQTGTLTIAAPYATGPIYMGKYTLPTPASDAAINFSIPFTLDGGMPHIRFSFREASGLTEGTLAASLHATREVV